MAGRPISPGRMQWLRGELAAWRERGLIDDDTAEQIAGSYVATTRPQAVRLFVYLGAGMLGIGLIWLIAANVDIDEVGPLMRFASVALLWLGLVAGAEYCAASGPPRLAGALRLLAALAYAGAVFQAAQSLQVPAYEPTLLLAVALGILAYAYAVAERAPLLVGVSTLAGWYVWALLEDAGGGAAVVLGLALAVPVAAGIAALHDAGDAPQLGGPWRATAAPLALGALFVAAIPQVLEDHDAGSTLPIVLGALAGGGLCAAGAARSPGARLELAGAVAVAAGAGLLALVAPHEAVDLWDDDPSGAQVAYTLLASALFIAAAIGVALIGVARERRALTDIAFAFLLVFVALQSFGLLATILSGAGLLLCAGALLLAIGVGLDRGRRRLLEEIDA